MPVVDELTILVKAEVDKAVADLKKAEGQTDKTQKEMSKFGQFLRSPAGILGGAAVAGVALSKLVAIGTDLFNAYAVQEKSLIQLNTALSNNDKITEGASQRFQAFASNLQSASIFGDELTLSLVSQLAAMGRTEEEITKIVQASADYSSATGKDFIGTAMQINKTFSGLAGELGESVGAIRGLTQEQLKNGDAVDIISGQYRGFAEAVGKSASGSVTQLNNAISDLKEAFGSDIARAFTPVISGLTSIIEKLTEAKNAAKNYQDFVNTGSTKNIDVNSALEETYRQLKLAQDNVNRGMGDYNTVSVEALKTQIDILEGARQNAYWSEKIAADTAKTATAEKQIADQKERQQKIIDEKYISARSLVISILESELTEYEKIQAQIEELQKTPWASGRLESDRLAAIEILSERLKSMSEIDFSQWEDQWLNVKFTTDELIDRWEEIPTVIINQRTELEKFTDQWDELVEAVEAYDFALGVARDTFSALGDLQQNQHDQEIANLEAVRDQMEENGQDTTEIDEMIADAKDDFAERQFKSQKATAIAEAIINGAVAAVGALKLGPAGIPLAAVIGALTAAQVGIIGSQQYVPMAQGGIVNGPTRALIGEAGPEAVIPLRDMDKGIGRNSGGVTVIQNVSGSIWQTKELEGLALGAVARASRGY